MKTVVMLLMALVHTRLFSPFQQLFQAVYFNR
jgi:hypothetical protein